MAARSNVSKRKHRRRARENALRRISAPGTFQTIIDEKNVLDGGDPQEGDVLHFEWDGGPHVRLMGLDRPKANKRDRAKKSR